MKNNIKKAAALLIAAAALFTGCSANTAETDSTADTEDYVLKIGYTGGLCEAPIQIAVENGYFDAEGLKYELVRANAATMADSVGSGQVEAGFGLLGKFLQPLDNGLSMKITAGIHTGCTKILAPADSDINTIADLKGKILGNPGLGSAPTIIAKRSLYKEGINIDPAESEVEFAVYDMGDLPAALANGSVDAVAMSDPQGAAAQRDYGYKCILDTATDPAYENEYCCISFVNTDIAENHPDIAEKFTKAVMKASLWVNDNIDETAQIQVDKNWVAGDPAENAQVLKTYNYKPSLEGALEALNISVPELQAIGLISETTDIDEFINNVYYKIDTFTDEDVYQSYNTAAAADNAGSVLQTSYTNECCTEITTECCTAAEEKPADCCA